MLPTYTIAKRCNEIELEEYLSTIKQNFEKGNQSSI